MDRSSKRRDSRTQFASLQPQTFYVTKGAVRKKWKKLSASSQENVRELLISAKKRSKGGRKKQQRSTNETERVVDELTTRLSERLPRMPFPPTATEEAFDFESTLHRIKQFEQQLTDNLHSMSLLRAQIQKEERLLVADRKEAEHLQESLRANDALRRQHTKHLHPVVNKARGPHSTSKAHDTSHMYDSNLDCNPNDLFRVLGDEAVSTILQQLRDHLGNMQRNIDCMQSIGSSMDSTSNVLSSLVDFQPTETQDGEKSQPVIS